VPAYIEDSGDANKLRFVTTRYGSTANVSITAVTGAGFTAETGIAVTAATASGTATLKKDGGGVTSVTIPFLDVATDAQIAAAIVTGGVGQPTGGTILATGTGGALVATVTATGAAHSIQIVGTSTNSGMVTWKRAENVRSILYLPTGIAVSPLIFQDSTG
jgi:hypothetical protein